MISTSETIWPIDWISYRLGQSEPGSNSNEPGDSTQYHMQFNVIFRTTFILEDLTIISGMHLTGYTCVYSYIYINIYICFSQGNLSLAILSSWKSAWPNRLELQNSPTASLLRGKTPQRIPVYDTKKFDGEASLILVVWVMRSTPLLTSFPGPLWSSVVAPDKFLSMG